MNSKESEISHRARGFHSSRFVPLVLMLANDAGKMGQDFLGAVVAGFGERGFGLFLQPRFFFLYSSGYCFPGQGFGFLAACFGHPSSTDKATTH
jgi:hypothetical protein